MKLSTLSALTSLLAWPINALIGWAIWNNVIVRIFNLPHLAYWEMLVIVILISQLMPNNSVLLGKIGDKINGE